MGQPLSQPSLPSSQMTNTSFDMAQSNTSSSPSSPADQALETTTASGSSSSPTSADMDTQLNPFPESRKRSRDTNSGDSMYEERQSRRARTGGYGSHQHERRNGTSTSAVRRPMTAMRGRQFSFPVGRRTTYREQERISEAFVNTGISAAPTPVISLTDTDRGATPSSPERTSRKRVHEEESDTSDDFIENGHSAKVRRRGRPQASTRNPTLRSVVRTAGVSRRFPNHEMRNRLSSQTQNEVEREALMTLYATRNHDSKAESILASSELSAAEAPSAEKDESGIERPVVVVHTFDEWKALLDADCVEDYRIIHQYDGVLLPRTPSPRGSLLDSNLPSSADAELESENRLFHQYDGFLSPRTPSPQSSSPDPNQLILSNAELEREHRLFHQYDGILPPRTPSPQRSSLDSDRPNSPQMPDREVFRYQSFSRNILDSSFSSETSSGEEDEELPAPLGEQRSRPFLSEPTPHFEMLLHEVETQIMYLCARERWDHDGREDKFLVIGTTGNLYYVYIGKNLTCSCFEVLGGNLCKHIVFVLVKVLMLEAPLRHQVAFLSSEVESMLDVIIIDDYSERKPAENCPICMDKIDEDENAITWCRNKCGVSYHQSCQLRWATTNWEGKQRLEDPTIVTKCGYCRAPWIYTMAELRSVIKMYGPENVTLNGDYYNVSKILGMKGPELSKTEEEDYQ